MRTEKLSAYYGAAQAMGDIDLGFEVGVVTAIIGPSGCGKSTLLRCLNRMHETTPGLAPRGASFSAPSRSTRPRPIRSRSEAWSGWCSRSPTRSR